jgi:hypothetical protein
MAEASRVPGSALVAGVAREVTKMSTRVAGADHPEVR